MKLGFRIPIVSGIPDSYSCFSDSKAQDSGFHEEKFPRFRIPRRKIPRFRNPDSLTWGDCFANLNLLLFCRSRCLCRRCCLSCLYNNATRHHIFYRPCRRASVHVRKARRLTIEYESERNIMALISFTGQLNNHSDVNLPVLPSVI